MRKLFIKDNKPCIKYKGRKIEINSDGTYIGTHVKINNVPMNNIKSMVIDFGSKPDDITIVKMEINDI